MAPRRGSPKLTLDNSFGETALGTVLVARKAADVAGTVPNHTPSCAPTRTVPNHTPRARLFAMLKTRELRRTASPREEVFGVPVHHRGGLPSSRVHDGGHGDAP